MSYLWAHIFVSILTSSRDETDVLQPLLLPQETCFHARQTSEEPKWCQSRMMPVSEKLIILYHDTLYARTFIA